jgi:2-dehydro-3-deoxyphosphogluconate aldolase/(4S)-4-hydroxy-2-oxoglutarate aldolase
MTKSEVLDCIEKVAIIPAVRVASADEALFVAESIAGSGIPIVELTMTVPGAIDVISQLARNRPEIIVGAGTVLSAETARRCLDAGAKFLTSTGLDLEIVEIALKEGTVVFPGALTPTEVMMARKAGADFVKIFPCAMVGGASYIKALKAPFRDVRLIASGGVNYHTAGDYILAGATALGVGGDLVPPAAIHLRQPHRIHELGRRFLAKIKETRAQMA